MSGGVDSSVTAALLLAQGYDVEGVSLRMWEGDRGPRNCSDHHGAKEIASLLGIPHTLIDLRSSFEQDVVKPFAMEYLRGRTPNPCVACNRDFKLGRLLNWAKANGGDVVATGHYARVCAEPEGSQVFLYRGADRAKDQSYFLFALTQEQLSATLFPLGEMQKEEVRDRARQLALPVADRPESQDICFGDYRALVESYAGSDDLLGGELVDGTGRVLARHHGIHGLTVGQRRGLGISAGEPLYVLKIEDDSRRVVVGRKEELTCRGLIARNVNWMGQPVEKELEAEVQIRYRSRAIPCVLQNFEHGSCEARFNSTALAVTPGQAAVFYQGERVLGGGWIERAIR